MKTCAAVMVLGAMLQVAGEAKAQTPAGDAVPAFPRTESAIREWDAAIVRRAAAMLASPAQWNRRAGEECTPDGQAVSIRCALQTSIDAATGRAATAHRTSSAQLSDCQLATVEARAEGSCGLFFDEATVFAVSRAKEIKTGRWRADASPSEVWTGRMINSANTVLQQARRMVDSIAPGKYKNARLVEFNDDSTVTFETLREYFRVLEDRVRKLSPAELAESADDVEIEIYTGGGGVIRTYNGWYAVSGFAAKGSTMRFQVDTAKQISPNALDREIVRRADALLSSDAVWNRADNRKCDPAARTWSIYCALEHATRAVTGGFNHRRPALEVVRVIVEERTKDRNYSHRLMDYNNDSTTHLNDVRTLFAAALARMK